MPALYTVPFRLPRAPPFRTSHRTSSVHKLRPTVPTRAHVSSTRNYGTLKLVMSTVMSENLEWDEYHSKWETMWTAGPKGLQAGEAFDANRASQALVHALETKTVNPTGKRALVPGCGRGYDVEEFAKHGASCALGLEISPAAATAANTYLASVGVDPSNGQVMGGDFFKYPDEVTEKFDFGYDYTFLCALHPYMRDDWAKAWAKLIKPGGELITLIFPVVEKEGGPPWAVHPDLYTNLLVSNGFVNVYLEAVPEEQSHPGRNGKEFFGRWKKL